MHVLAKKFSGPRHATAAEGAPLLRFINRIFHAGLPDGMEGEYPHLYGDMTTNLEWTHVITHRNSLVAHLGVYPLDVVSPGGRLRVGGIGAVATHDRFRGHGLMSALLDHATGWMRTHGMPASILWGDHLRYARFGWTGAGAKLQFSLNRRSASFLARWTLPVTAVRDVVPLAPELHALHRTLPVRVERSAAVFPLVLAKSHRRVYVARSGQRVAAYALVQRWESRGHVSFNVQEVAGATAGILSLFRWFATRPGVDQVKAEAPIAHQPHLVELLRAADGWSTSIGHVGQIKVVDLEGVAAAYRRPALARAVRRARIAPLDQPGLLFGPLSAATLLPPSPARNRMARDLPLQFYLNPSDHV